MLILKNLTAHKLRNKMTSIIYSLALGFIIFLIVSYNLQLQTAIAVEQKEEGSTIQISTVGLQVLKPGYIENTLKEFYDNIEAFSYLTHEVERWNSNGISSATVSDRARLNEKEMQVVGVSPQIF